VVLRGILIDTMANTMIEKNAMASAKATSVNA
jgi:hypothetical protein